MQQRRLRPGDVLDDYCPRERRITDHAIVAMIDDNIKQTRCVVCDAEHEYKQGKVPAQRRKKAQSGLFSQVLDGLGAPPMRLPQSRDSEASEDAVEIISELDAEMESVVAAMPAEVNPSGNGHGDSAAVAAAVIVAVAEPEIESESEPESLPRRDEGPVRRSLIRATLPRPEGQQPPARAIPEFTIRQPSNGRNRSGHRRRGSHQQQHGMQGPMRFGRGGHGQRPGGGRHGNPNGNRSGGPRRGGKKR